MLILFFASISIVMFTVVSENDFTLTTMKINDYELDKPTTLQGYRRINVENIDIRATTPWKRNIENNLSEELEETQQNIPSRRMISDNIWKWDYWCQLQPRKGNCSNFSQRFYYDIKFNECHPFVYGGCFGNRNNFVEKQECELNCKGTTMMPVQKLRYPKYCSLQADSGRCLALMYKYYYDIRNSSCVEFIWGGCGGNQNTFDTSNECYEECGHV